MSLGGRPRHSCAPAGIGTLRERTYLTAAGSGYSGETERTYSSSGTGGTRRVTTTYRYAATVPPWSFVGRDAELRRLDRGRAAGTTGRGLILGGAAGHRQEPTARARASRPRPGPTRRRGRRPPTPPRPACRWAAWPRCCRPTSRPARSPAGLLRWAVDALHRQAAGRPIVLAIDDAHLLDPLSAALVYYVARAEHATVLATVRTGEPVPDPIRALWTDDLVERVELGPLDRGRDRRPAAPGARRAGRLGLGRPAVAALPGQRAAAARAGHRRRGRRRDHRGVRRLALDRPARRWRPTLTEVVDARIGELTPTVRDGAGTGRVRRADRAAAAGQGHRRRPPSRWPRSAR